mgnify:CR=1 FL=1
MSEYFDNKELLLGPKMSQYGSHMLITDVKKETKTKHVNIDTRFRDDYNDGNKNVISLPERINDVHSICATNVEVPMTFNNISSSLENNSIKIVDDANTETVITIADGQYNIEGIKDALNTAIATAIGGSHVAFNVVNNKITIQTQASYTIDFNISNSSYTKKYLRNKLGYILGFRKQTYLIETTITSESFAMTPFPHYLYLVVDEMITQGNINTFVSPMSDSIINKNILSRISLDKNQYDFNTVLPANIVNGYLTTSVRNYQGKMDLQRLNIQLVNEYGQVMDLNGQDISLCLKLVYD